MFYKARDARSCRLCLQKKKTVNNFNLISDPACANVSPLPDLNRRSPSYMVTLNELMINDKDLKEAWYNLGRYQLSDASVSPAEGSCGTEYPLYLNGSTSTRCFYVLNIF